MRRADPGPTSGSPAEREERLSDPRTCGSRGAESPHPADPVYAGSLNRL